MELPQHSLMVNHFQEYATTKGFLLLDYPKQYFTTTEYSNYFPGESNQSLGSNTIKSTNQTRRGYMRCSSKSHGRTKGDHCCFNVPYYWNPSKQNFMFRPGGSNLSHNHQLVPQSTVVDGRTIVNMESSLSPEEFNSIKEQSRCRVNIPLMHVNLEEYILFEEKMIKNIRKWCHPACRLKRKWPSLSTPDGSSLKIVVVELNNWWSGKEWFVQIQCECITIHQ